MGIFFAKYLILGLIAVILASCGTPPVEDPTKTLPADGILELAREELNEDRYEAAIDLYRKLESRFPYGIVAEQAQLEVAYAYHKFNEPELAVAAAERFIRLHPTHTRVDYAYYLKGIASYRERSGIMAQISGTNDLSNRDPNPARIAYSTFKEVVTRYPQSPYTEDSRKRMVHLINVLAKHDISVARYYLSRGAYVAVVNRTKNILKEYDRTPAVEDALGLMAIAYREMGITDLMADTVRILRHNFPQSDYLRQL
jgi:outer membrane protein assembly factor BamD